MNPLYPNFMREMREEARRSFEQTDAVRLLRDVQRASTLGRRGADSLTLAVARYSRSIAPDKLVRDVLGSTEFGQLSREVMRYGRSDSPLGHLYRAFLKSLGPAGSVLDALTRTASTGSRGIDAELELASNLLRAFGYGVTAPKDLTIGDIGTAAESAKDFLERMGYRVLEPESPESPPSREPFRERVGEMRPGLGQRPDQQRAGHQQAETTDPTFTGAMVEVASSNVYAIGYDIDSGYLYVRFRRDDGEGHKLDAPGSLYRYSGVSEQEFRSFLAAPSKGSWVWDHLRVRGTVSGHQKDYDLVGVVGAYVPRKATYVAQNATLYLPGGVKFTSPARGEAYVPRQVIGTKGSVLKSTRPFTMVRGG